MRICGTIPGQFPNYQIDFIEHVFGGCGRIGHSLRHTKLPSLLQKRLLRHVVKSAERQPYWEENRIERTTANPRASARKKDEPLGIDR
jgi:hypothetical protein